jgi:hypothetical protein
MQQLEPADAYLLTIW